MKFVEKTKITVVTLLLILLSTVQVNAENGGKGGDASTGGPVKPEEMQAILKDIQMPLRLFYNYISVAFWNDTGYMATVGMNSTGKKLFPETGPDIFEKIRKVTPTIDWTGWCTGAKDAVTTTNPDRVCYNIPNIIKHRQKNHINSSNVFMALVALSAHEYSHLLDTNEGEAGKIQDFAKQDLSETMRFKYAEWVKNTRKDLQSVDESVSALYGLVSGHAELSDICLDIGKVMIYTGLVSNQSFNAGYNGMSIFSRREWNQALPDLYKVGNLNSFCQKSEKAQEALNQIWQGRDRITLQEYLDAIGSKGYIKVAGSVPYIPFGDFDRLRPEVLGLVDAIETLIGFIF